MNDISKKIKRLSQSLGMVALLVAFVSVGMTAQAQPSTNYSVSAEEKGCGSSKGCGAGKEKKGCGGISEGENGCGSSKGCGGKEKKEGAGTE